LKIAGLIFIFFILNSIHIFSLDYNTKIVIFCYHTFNHNKNEFSVKDETLKEHIDLARKKGFDIISEKQLYDYYYNDGVLKPKCLMFTVDDGYLDCYKEAFNIFKEKNVKASFFIYTRDIGTKKFLTWDEIFEMRKDGMSFGSHSKTHFTGFKLFRYKKKKEILSTLNDEILGSADYISRMIGEDIFSYAHPFGTYNSLIEKIADERYKLVYTTVRAPNVYESSPKRLNRYVIVSKDTSSDIANYLDYELLPVKKTIPDNGDKVGTDKKVCFYFKNMKDLNRFEDFSFIIDNKEYRANIEKSFIWLDTKYITKKVYDVSLVCHDRFNRKFIYSILIGA
jgi:peptidoglycan/xylan/chitin deacetylase (PgdA/CDA1 family)